MKQRVIKVGNSLGVTIPSEFVKAIGVKAGDMVLVKKQIENNQVIYKFTGVQQLAIVANFLKKKGKKRK